MRGKWLIVVRFRGDRDEAIVAIGEFRKQGSTLVFQSCCLEKCSWGITMTVEQQIEAFLAGSPHAVVGASQDREKYGNKVLRAYLQRQRAVYPVNPTARVVEGLAAFPDLPSLPESVHGISIVTPPQVTEQVVIGFNQNTPSRAQPAAMSSRSTCPLSGS